jgi:plastocyanin
VKSHLLGIVAVLALAACSAPASTALEIGVADFMIEPVAVETAGPTVTITVINDGPTPHNLTVRDADGTVVMGTEDLSVGDTETITGELDPGEYVIFCALPGHESLGMRGTLTVTDGS